MWYARTKGWKMQQLNKGYLPIMAQLSNIALDVVFHIGVFTGRLSTRAEGLTENYCDKWRYITLRHSASSLARLCMKATAGRFHRLLGRTPRRSSPDSLISRLNRLSINNCINEQAQEVEVSSALRCLQPLWMYLLLSVLSGFHRVFK